MGAGQCFWLGRSRPRLCSLLEEEMPRKDNLFLCSAGARLGSLCPAQVKGCLSFGMSGLKAAPVLAVEEE